MMLFSVILWAAAIGSSIIQFLTGYFHRFSFGFFMPIGFTFFMVWMAVYIDGINIFIIGAILIIGFLWYVSCYIKGRNLYNRKNSIEKGHPSN